MTWREDECEEKGEKRLPYHWSLSLYLFLGVIIIASVVHISERNCWFLLSHNSIIFEVLLLILNVSMSRNTKQSISQWVSLTYFIPTWAVASNRW